MTPEARENLNKLSQQEGDSLFIFKQLLGNSCQHISISNAEANTEVAEQQGLQAS